MKFKGVKIRILFSYNIQEDIILVCAIYYLNLISNLISKTFSTLRKYYCSDHNSAAVYGEIMQAIHKLKNMVRYTIIFITG